MKDAHMTRLIDPFERTMVLASQIRDALDRLEEIPMRKGAREDLMQLRKDISLMIRALARDCTKAPHLRDRIEKACLLVTGGNE
jgi:hypothetical protein